MRNIRATEPIPWVGYIRPFLGVIFLATGVMKFLFPELRAAWSGQLIAADIPLYSFNFVFVPILEILLGSALVIGTYSRLAALGTVPLMLVATYVHIRVDDPALFPLQPHAPIAPLILLVLAAIIMIKGGGAWSQDLKAKGKATNE